MRKKEENLDAQNSLFSSVRLAPHQVGRDVFCALRNIFTKVALIMKDWSLA